MRAPQVEFIVGQKPEVGDTLRPCIATQHTQQLIAAITRPSQLRYALTLRESARYSISFRCSHVRPSSVVAVWVAAAFAEQIGRSYKKIVRQLRRQSLHPPALRQNPPSGDPLPRTQRHELRDAHE